MATMTVRNPGKSEYKGVSDGIKERFAMFEFTEKKKEDPRVVGPYDKYFSAYQ
jgi:hypothetical protein